VAGSGRECQGVAGSDGAFVSLRQAGPCHKDTNKGLQNSYHDT
jgi:hypothetical protein